METLQYALRHATSFVRMTSGVSLAAVLAMGAAGDQGKERDARAEALLPPPTVAAVAAMNAAALEPASVPAVALVERRDSLARTASAPEALGIATGSEAHAPHHAQAVVTSWLPAR